MNSLKVKKVEVDVKKLRLTSVGELPAGTMFVGKPAIIRDENDNVIMGYHEPATDFSRLIHTLKNIKYDKSERTGGLPTRSRIFGCAPRITIRKDYCSKCMLALEDEKADATLKEYGKIAEDFYEATNPEVHAKHKEKVQNIRPEWRMDGTLWTQGIVNWNNQLRYHKDQGNFPDTWSAMLTFRKDVHGGYLYMPEYNMAFSCNNGSICTFNGQAILHGVTKIRLQNPSAYRYSIVYYSLAQMTKCLAPIEELNRIRKVKTERELERVRK